MKLLNDFYEYAKSLGIGKEHIYEEEGEGFTLVSFGEEGEPGVIYNIALVFYDNDTVEVYVRKQLKEFDTLNVLTQINEWNAEYCGVTFVLEDDMVMVKSYCDTKGDIQAALKEMVQDMQLAKRMFRRILNLEE